MKTKLFILFIITTFLSCGQEKQETYLKVAKDFQYKMNLDFADKGSSPLTEKDFQVFSNLNFFPIQKKFRVTASFKKTPNKKPFKMLTTTSMLARYVQFGIANFSIDNKQFTLRVYQNVEGEKHLFLPYFDNTNGKESYAGGRYIELTYPTDETIIIDFNQSYNPYCAYNHKYSCPIPPEKNYIDIRIQAGVKKFH